MPIEITPGLVITAGIIIGAGEPAPPPAVTIITTEDDLFLTTETDQILITEQS
jgi:hypothetical protein